MKLESECEQVYICALLSTPDNILILLEDCTMYIFVNLACPLTAF